MTNRYDATRPGSWERLTQAERDAWIAKANPTRHDETQSEINAAAQEADAALQAEIARSSGPTVGGSDIVAYWAACRDHEIATKYQGPAFPSFEDWKRGARP